MFSYLSPSFHTIDLCVRTCLSEIGSGGLCMAFHAVRVGADGTHRGKQLTRRQMNRREACIGEGGGRSVITYELNIMANGAYPGEDDGNDGVPDLGIDGVPMF